MKLYLAASWSRKDEIKAYAEQLNLLPNVIVKARWLFEPVPEGIDFKDFAQERAKTDVEDVRYADALVRFTDDLSGEYVPPSLATGGRMFEMGLAYALGKTVIAVGGVQPIFDYLPEIIHVANFEELCKWLGKKESEQQYQETGAVRHG